MNKIKPFTNYTRLINAIVVFIYNAMQILFQFFFIQNKKRETNKEKQLIWDVGKWSKNKDNCVPYTDTPLG